MSVRRRVLSLLLLLAAAALHGADLLDIRGQYLLFSYDFNYLMGAGEVQIKGERFTLSVARFDLDMAAGRGVAAGGVVLNWGGRTVRGDWAELELENMEWRVYLDGDPLRGETFRIGPTTKTPQTDRTDPNAGQQPEKPPPVPFSRRDAAALQESLVYYLSGRMEVKSDRRVIGHAVTVFMEGMPYFTLRRWNMSIGLGLASEKPVSVDALWVNGAQGLHGEVGLRFTRKSGKTEWRHRGTIGLNWDIFRKNDWRGNWKASLDLSSTVAFAPDREIRAAVFFVRENMLNPSLTWRHRWNSVFSSGVQLDYREPSRNKSELWLRMETQIDGRGLGQLKTRFNFERRDQHSHETEYNKRFSPYWKLVVRHNETRLLVGTSANRLNHFSSTLSYESRLLHVDADYSLNRDLLYEQVQSSPQLRFRLEPLRFYGGLLKLNVFTTLALNHFRRSGGAAGDVRRADMGVGVESDALPLTASTSLAVALQAEQFLDNSNQRDALTAGVVWKARQRLGDFVELVFTYNVQTRRSIRDFFVSGTTSQDGNLMLKLRERPSGLSGWTSVAYDAKRGRFTTAYLDAQLSLFRRWALQSQLNYDFLGQRLFYDFFLARKAGHITFRFCYRSVGGFMVELLKN